MQTRIDAILDELTLEEKISLLSGADMWSTKAVPRLGIPSLRLTDGPHGVRNTCAPDSDPQAPTTCFPTAVAMAASWNPELVQKVGIALGRETKAQGRHVLLGPCVNLHRTPLGGRNFESFSEDPFLTAAMGIAYIYGVQSRGAATSLKHFACNNQEIDRTTISAEVDERTLRELYLFAFERIVRETRPWTVMCSYNRINGTYASANGFLLTDLLRDEFGFDGLVVSDWAAVHDTVPVIEAGLDLEMPGPGVYLGAPLLQALVEKRTTVAEIDRAVGNLLQLIVKVGLLDNGNGENGGAPGLPADVLGEHHRLVRTVAAESIVLLKNRDNILPLDRARLKSIAVIGPNADVCRLGGGGSSWVTPPYSVSPLAGIRNKVGSAVAVGYRLGCALAGPVLAVEPEYLRVSAAESAKRGLKAEYFNNAELTGSPAWTGTETGLDRYWATNSPHHGVDADCFSARWTGKLLAPNSGDYRFCLVADDKARLFVNDTLVLDNWDNYPVDEPNKTRLFLKGGSHDIRLEFCKLGGNAGVKLLWDIPQGRTDIAAAAEAAENADVAIVFAGLSAAQEGEGLDKTDMKMPEPQDELIRAVCKANPNTIVVLNSGTPLDMSPWIDSVKAVVEAWYPGMEGGNAIADILFGDVNPSGKLPTTFPRRLEDNPSHGNYPGADGKVEFKEGIFIGYRHYEKNGIEPLFPFGHGLSYTTFQYDNLSLSRNRVPAGKSLVVRADITNTGARTGQETVQLYIRDIESSVERPVKELKNFRKIGLAPGEKQTVTFRLTEDELSFFDPELRKWTAEPGEFEVLLGASSQDIRLRGTFCLGS